VRLYSIGDDGEAIRDIQGRLTALGYEISPDRTAAFGAGTKQAVIEFQRRRGLAADGIVGPETWGALVGAGYHFGERLLYRRVPMMRGDDVAELQLRLDALGFSIGKVDGVFGPETLAGLLDFQANRRLAEDGMMGTEVMRELKLMDRTVGQAGREAFREQQWLYELPGHLVGQRVYVDPACGDEPESSSAFRTAAIFSRIIQDLGAIPIMSRSIDTSPPAQVRAVRANRLGVDVIVSFALANVEPPAVLYFASAHSFSLAGRSLALCIGARLGLSVVGKAIPMLKETRAPAVVIQAEFLEAQIGGNAAQGIIDFYAASESSQKE